MKFTNIHRIHVSIFFLAIKYCAINAQEVAKLSSHGSCAFVKFAKIVASRIVETKTTIQLWEYVPVLKTTLTWMT